jgi:hypothetical protein
MKRLTQFVLALVMMIQGMQMAVAAVNVPAHAATQNLSPKDQFAIAKYINSLILAVGHQQVPVLFAKAQIRGSATRPRLATVLPLGTAGGLVNARWTAVPDASEAAKGLKAGTGLIVSSESSKLTKKQRAALAKTPKLLAKLFPGSENGMIPAGTHNRVTFQAGESLNLAGRVAPSVRKRATIVIESAHTLSDGTLGPWVTLYTLAPDQRGRFSQDMVVNKGPQSVRARLEVTRKNPQAVMTTAGTGMISTPVSTSDMPFNTFGITTPPWQVANNQGFDNNGNYYASDYSGGSTSDPVDGTPIVWQGITFPIGPVPTSDKQVGGKDGPKNVVHAAEQTITLPAGSFDWLYLAGAGANGNQVNQAFTLNFTDGTTETWTQSFTDWTNNGNPAEPQLNAGESVIREQSYRINQLGNNVVASTYTYGYTHHIPKGKTLASLKLPNNNNLGILSVVAATEPPIDGAKVKSYVLTQTNLTGTDLVTLKISNQQSDPLTFSVANWPVDGCNPTTSTSGCTYSTGQVTVNPSQTKTVTYVAPSSWNNMGFSVQKAGDVCVGPNCSTYLPDWSAGVNGTSCSDVSPSAGQNMAAGQTWTIYAQSQTTGYNGFLDGPGMPGSQNSNKYPNGCVFAMNTAFQNWIANQPGWAKWLEAAVGVAALIGISFLTFGLPEEAEAGILAEAEGDALVDGPIEADANAAGFQYGGWYEGEFDGTVRGWRGPGLGWLQGSEYGMGYGLNLADLIL